MAEKAKVSDMTPLAYMGLVALAFLTASAVLWGIQNVVKPKMVAQQ